MCSIFGILDIKSDAAALRKSALEMSKRLRHRGPDWSGVYSSDIENPDRRFFTMLGTLVQGRVSLDGAGSGANGTGGGRGVEVSRVACTEHLTHAQSHFVARDDRVCHAPHGHLVCCAQCQHR